MDEVIKFEIRAGIRDRKGNYYPIYDPANKEQTKEEIVNSEIIKVFKCEICDKETKTEASLKAHKTRFHKEIIK
jgi:hypothetical protein